MKAARVSLFKICYYLLLTQIFMFELLNASLFTTLQYQAMHNSVKHTNKTSHKKASNHIHHNPKQTQNSIKRREKVNNKLASRTLNVDEPEFDLSLVVSKQKDLSMSQDTSARFVNVTAILGQNTLLSCAVRNLGSYNILWLRVKDGDVLAYDDMLITQDPRFRLIKKSHNESSLFIQGVKLSDAGEYACQINTQLVKSKFLNLVVLTPPVFSEIELSRDVNNEYYSHLALASRSHQTGLENQSPKLIQVVEGKNMILECNAYGQPKPTINWYVKRYRGDNLTVYSLNTNKIQVNNVMRNQYEYFECEASNKLPPSISKKFKINVLFKPEITVNPPKIHLIKLPTRVKFDCMISSFPTGQIYWVHYKNLKNGTIHNNRKEKAHNKKTQREMPNLSAGKKKPKKNHNRTREKANRKLGNRNLADDAFMASSATILNLNPKYEINDVQFNDTFKSSVITISVETEEDLGEYECFSNNTAGSRALKFFIHGEKLTSNNLEAVTTTIAAKMFIPTTFLKPIDATKSIMDSLIKQAPLSTTNLNANSLAVLEYENNKKYHLETNQQQEENKSDHDLLIKNESILDKEIKFDLTTESSLQQFSPSLSSSSSSTPLILYSYNILPLCLMTCLLSRLLLGQF